MKRLSDTLRNEIKTCGISCYRICKDTGIDKAALSRFLQGGGLNINTVDILIDYFGLEIKKKRGRK